MGSKFCHNILYGCQGKSSQKNWFLWWNLYQDHLKVEGLDGDIFWDLPFKWGFWPTHSKFAKSLWLGDAQLWSCPIGKKISPNSDILAEICGLQTRKGTCGYKCTWYTLGSSWDYLLKHVIPNPQKILNAWNMVVIYVILAHMIVGNTLSQYIPSILVDCHLMGCKPLENLRRRPILGCMST